MKQHIKENIEGAGGLFIIIIIIGMMVYAGIINRQTAKIRQDTIEKWDSVTVKLKELNERWTIK